MLRKLVPKFVRRSYALKFMIVLLALGLAVGAGAYLGTVLIAEETKEQTLDRQAEFTEQEAVKIQNLHERNELITETVATSSLVASDDEVPPNRLREYLVSEQDRHDGAENVHIVDVENREVVISTSSELDGVDFDDVHTAWSELESADAEAADSDLVGVHEAQFLGEYTDHDGTFVVGYAAPVPADENDDDPSELVAVYSVGLEPFGEELIENDGQLSYLVNPTNNRILMDPTGESIWHTYEDGRNLVSASSSYSIGEPGGSLSASIAAANQGAGYEDDAYIASYAQLTDGTNWYIVHHTREDETLGFVYTLQEYGSYAALAGILGVVLVGGIIGRNTSQSINRLSRKAEEMGKGDLDVEFETARIDSIGQLYNEFGIMRDSLGDQIQAVEAARLEAEAAQQETERVNGELERKADEYRNVMRECAAGDFTTRMDPETDNEAMREIAGEFNEMITEIERTTDQLKAFANEVATASEEVTASSESVKSASVQVSESVQEISEGADKQNDSLRAVNQEMSQLSTTTEEIAASSNEVADIAERTAQTGSRGRDAAQEAIDGMNAIETESDVAVEEIERLQEEVERIDDLLEFITEIAEQTNMLALNANIEASRSINSDEGFSVVAGEVKELAEKTKEATGDIETRLDRIKEQTELTAREVQQTSAHISEQTASVERAVEALDGIAEYAGKTNDGVQEISAASQQQAASTQEVVAMVDDAATISEETTVEAESVAAAAEEQTSALVEVTRSTEDLSAQAAQLSEALGRFETDAAVTAGDGSDDGSESAAPSIPVDDEADASVVEAVDAAASHDGFQPETDAAETDDRADTGTEAESVHGSAGDADDDNDTSIDDDNGTSASDDTDTSTGDDTFTFGEDDG